MAVRLLRCLTAACLRLRRRTTYGHRQCRAFHLHRLLLLLCKMDTWGSRWSTAYRLPHDASMGHRRYRTAVRICIHITILLIILHTISQMGDHHHEPQNTHSHKCFIRSDHRSQLPMAAHQCLEMAFPLREKRPTNRPGLLRIAQRVVQAQARHCGTYCRKFCNHDAAFMILRQDFLEMI